MDTPIWELTALDTAQLDQLCDILIALVDGGASIGFLPPLDRTEAAAYWRSVPKAGTRLLVDSHDGRLAGTVQLHLEPRANGRHRAEIAKLLVHPTAQRRGIGRALMVAAEQLAREASRTLLVLDTREGDVSNALYRSLGFIEAGRIPHYAQSGTGTLDTTVIFYKEV